MKTMNPGEMSDGFHTFNELYDHRHQLFAAFIRLRGGWKSKKHSDETMFDGMFIAGTLLPEGQISYHLPIDLFDEFPAAEYELAPEWDGHTPADVVKRLRKFAAMPTSNCTRMKEGWVEFNRYKFADGHIDIWQGDSAQDPNSPVQRKMCLNHITAYVRLNGAFWLSRSEFNWSQLLPNLGAKKMASASGIWNLAKRRV